MKDDKNLEFSPIWAISWKPGANDKGVPPWVEESDSKPSALYYLFTNGRILDVKIEVI